MKHRSAPASSISARKGDRENYASMRTNAVRTAVLDSGDYVGPSILPYIYRWNRQERKGQPCKVLARGTMNSCLVEFADGYRMVTSRNAIKRNSSLTIGQ